MESLEQFLSKFITFQFITIAGETVLVYDYLLTFPLELDYIWRTRWSAVKIIYLISRYGSLIGQSVFTLEVLGVLSHGSLEFCTRFEGFIIVLGILPAEVIRILVLQRAWAIWGCRRYSAIALISAYILYLTTIGGMYFYTMVIRGDQYFEFIYLAETGACVTQTAPNARSSFDWILPMISLVLDCIVFVMVVKTLGKLFRETRLLRPTLPRVLFMDAALYITASVLVSVVGILAQTVFLYNPLIYLRVACNPAVVVAGQRVVVNLRSMRSLPYSQQVFELDVDVDSSPVCSDISEPRPPGDQRREQDIERNQDLRSGSGVRIELITV